MDMDNTRIYAISNYMFCFEIKYFIRVYFVCRENSFNDPNTQNSINSFPLIKMRKMRAYAYI